MPPRSTKAPKSAMFLTSPLRVWPSAISDSSVSRFSARSSSSSWRRETTMLRRSSSILTILARTTSPIMSAGSAVRRRSICEAGMKTSTPSTLISRPPLIFFLTSPSMMSLGS